MWSPSTKPFLFLHYFDFCFNRFAPILFPKSSPRKQNHKWLGSVHFSSNSYLTCDCIECYWVNWIVTPFRSVLPLNLVMEEFSTYCWKQLRSLVIARYDWLWNPVPLFRAMRMKKGTHPVLLHANIFFPRFDENRWLVLLFLFFRALWSWQIRIMIGW